MNVLFICNKSPYPPVEGGPIAMNALIEGLADAGHEVKVLALESSKFSVDLKNVPEEYMKKTRLETIHADLRIKFNGLIASILTNKSYHVSRFESEHIRQRIVAVLQKQHFDIVQLETLYMCPYISTIRKYSDAKIVLRAHNIEHLLWERIAVSSRNPIKKPILYYLAKTLKAYELQAITSVDAIAAISPRDATWFAKYGHGTPVEVIPFGIRNHQSSASSNQDPGEFSLFHIGSMNWIPNEEGIRWFLETVWPEINKRFPSVKLHLAGRHMADWLKNYKFPGVVIEGEVPESLAFIEKHTAMIVPLLSGSGIRIKIIEAMLASRAVISTTTGAEGIEYTRYKDILLADTPQEFIEAISFCIENPEKVKEIGIQARSMVIQKHDNKKVIDKLLVMYQNILAA